MAIAIAFPIPSPASARAALRAPQGDVPPRVYSPFGQRRLARPMAVRLAEADREGSAPPGRSRGPFIRFRGR